MEGKTYQNFWFGETQSFGVEVLFFNEDDLAWLFPEQYFDNLRF